MIRTKEDHAEPLKRIGERLTRRLGRLRFDPPVACVYNPLSYARPAYEQYLDRYAGLGAKVILLGMNPGPWGMVQTGVPFGEVESVRHWLGIDAKIGSPRRVHPARPVLGWSCDRREVSGARLWGWARDRFASPGAFFRCFFVANYCPLAFLEAGGRNRTPDRLPRSEREPLLAICDEALRETMVALEPEIVIGVGAFSARRAKQALVGLGVRVGQILHPSPASPAANRGWVSTMEGQLRSLGVALPGEHGQERAV